MKQLSIIMLLVLYFNYAQSQSVSVSEFIGTLQLSNKQTITYKINFHENEDGKIEGTSLTDIYGKNRTQSSIKGMVNGTTNTISFYETQNISTKSISGKDEFCYVNVMDARIKLIAEKTVIQGTFTGKYPDGKTCAKGSIYLISISALKDLDKQIPPSTNDSLKILKDRINMLLSKTEDHYLRHNEMISIGSANNEITLEVWDGGGEEDNDEISIWVNDTKVGENVEIKRERKLINIPLNNSSSNEIKILAVNEGKWKPCTANLLLKDGKRHTPIITVLKKGESTKVEIKKLKQ